MAFVPRPPTGGIPVKQSRPVPWHLTMNLGIYQVGCRRSGWSSSSGDDLRDWVNQLPAGGMPNKTLTTRSAASVARSLHDRQRILSTN